ncbi:zinc ribbon domain-containing protein [Hyphomicrobium sp.]|uniref:zinc ribbon domain-containing protein n=1 Tax=Hyphomicrobium sp. TaxID=82 RepID=UPI003563DBD2
MIEAKSIGADWGFTVMPEAGVSAEATSARFCANCGTALQGKFCGACGAPAVAPVPEQAPEGWGSLTSEFLSSHGSNGIFAVALSFLRHPVDTIIRLTDDPTYRSQWGFLTATVGAQMTLAYVLLPRIYAALFNVPSAANNSAVVTNEIVQYVGMVILTPIQFYVCRALGTLPRSPMSYVKLCALSVSYGALLSTLVSLGFFVTGVTALKSGITLDLSTLWNGLSALTLVAVLVFVTMSHKRFWGMSWPIAIGVTLAIAVVSWRVVYPGLFALVERGGIAGAISGLTGG